MSGVPVANLHYWANKEANRAGIDPRLFHKMITQESAWNPNAVSPKGAVGLGQVIPKYGADPGFGVTPISEDKLRDPQENLRYSADYLAAMMNRYDHDPAKALAAYNAGFGVADGWDGSDISSLPDETQGYLNSILGPDHNALAGKVGQTFTPNVSSKDPETPLDQSNGGFFQNMGQGFSGFVDKVKNTDFDSPEWNDKLLAIGAGLLSGDDWQSGFAGAAQNLVAVNDTHRQREHQVEMQGMRDDARNASRFDQIVGNVRLDDGSVVFAQMNGGRMYDLKGNDISDRVSHEINNSDAANEKAQMKHPEYTKVLGQLDQDVGTLRAFDRVFEAAQTLEGGLAGRATDLAKFYNTLVGRGLSSEQLERGLTQAELQGLIGKTKDDVVGGGVMTEQDAARVIMALGGDMQTLASNPELLAQRIQTLRESRLRSYNTTYGILERQNELFPHLQYTAPERYQAPEGLYDNPTRGRPTTTFSNEYGTTTTKELEDILGIHGI